MVDTQAPYAATQDQILAAQRAAAQAAATNAAYLANALPVLPKYAAGGGATYTQAELQDAASEAAKHEAAFHPPDINYAAYANVPLSQMPANVASRVQEYYTRNPSERAQAITQQYAAQHQIAQNPFAEDSAAGIAWEVARTTGGAGNITESMRATAGVESRATYGVDVFEGIPTVSGISTVPTRDVTSGMLSGSKMVAALPSGTTTTYMPYGEFAQIEMKGSKLLLDERTGELGVYQQPFGHSSFMLTGGGGRAALQSGMFTVEKAETPYVVEQGKVGSYILPSGKGLSRLGAEAYGGLVRPLDDRTLAPNEAISRYAGTTGKYNLANLVSQIPAGKAEVPGAKIPWSVSEESPAIQYMDKGGIIPGSAISVPSGGSLAEGRLVGGKTIAGIPTVTETGVGALSTPFLSMSSKAAESTTTIVPSTGELPFIGKIPYISDALSFVSPQEEVTVTKRTTVAPDVTNITLLPAASKTEAGKPYTIGETTYYPSTTTTIGGETRTTTSGTKTTETETRKTYDSPLNLFVRNALPELGEEHVIGGGHISEETKGGKYLLDIVSPGLGKTVGEATKGPVSFVRGAVPMSPVWAADTYENVRKDAAKGAASAAITILLVGAGTVAKGMGLGEGLLAPTTKAGGLYQTASVVASGTLLGVYGSDVTKRVTGSSISQWVPIGQTKEQQGGGYIEGIKERFPGWEEARKELNVVETQEILPMAAAYKATSYVGDKVIGYAKTRGIPEIVNPEASGYSVKEGFPTSPEIKTPDLVSSFKTGTITLENPAKLGEVSMAPYGEPIVRIPTGTQIGAKPGKSFIYSGAEYPHLNVGHVGEGASEIPGLYTAPQRISYFTKAGESQFGGFGITKDILGIYKSPSVYRVSVESGKYQEIPKNLLNAPTPVDPLTGKPYSTNDPLNPKNVAISEWMRTDAKPGIPVIGQYGKSEWQYLIPPGSELTPGAKVTGWYRDAGQRIPQYDVSFTGKRAEGYKPPQPTIDPRTGLPVREVGRAAMGVSSESISGMSKKAIPLGASAAFGKGIPTETTVTRTTPSKTTTTSFPTTRVTSYATPSYKGKTPSSGMSYPKTSDISTSGRTSPSTTSKTSTSPSLMTYPPTSKLPSSSITSSKSTTTTPRTSTTTTGFPKTTTTATTTPKITTTTTPKTSETTSSKTTETTTPHVTKTTSIITSTTGLPGWTPSGGGAGGGYKKGSRAYVETLGFETSRGRKGAWTFGKRKAKK
jgi:hypothetical protein